MRGAARSSLAFLATVALLAVGLVALDRGRAAQTTWSVGGWWLPAVAAVGAPVVAFVDAACDDCARPFVQLRVCAAAGADDCDVSARVAPASTGVTRLRYPRPLAPGAYRVEVLLLDVDAWGAARTRERLSGLVGVE